MESFFLVRVFYIGIFYLYITSELPIMHLSAQPKENYDYFKEMPFSGGWVCTSTLSDVAQEGWHIKRTSNDHLAISNRKELTEGVVVVFESFPNRFWNVKCESRPISPISPLLFMMDFMIHVGAVPKVELARWTYLVLTLYKLFHFVFVF